MKKRLLTSALLLVSIFSLTFGQILANENTLNETILFEPMDIYPAERGLK